MAGARGHGSACPLHRGLHHRVVGGRGQRWEAAPQPRGAQRKEWGSKAESTRAPPCGHGAGLRGVTPSWGPALGRGEPRVSGLRAWLDSGRLRQSKAADCSGKQSRGAGRLIPQAGRGRGCVRGLAARGLSSSHEADLRVPPPADLTSLTSQGEGGGIRGPSPPAAPEASWSPSYLLPARLPTSFPNLFGNKASVQAGLAGWHWPASEGPGLPSPACLQGGWTEPGDPSST